ncbi:VOC family protein [Gulosibacter molinativorax]|uniref:VOC family protein n=1 Tax=Gulosibacter molinativorax TaxID=256821 RepID=A0ABT7C978_9MICO|nr:VOC family protein [Gulosibacter molinativorax]MDJ1371324.1 VOC family protein [Gulosibacter molinativorax]QUY63612.1 3-demethylubiquinone-9 3-methyltransferase [Gulosibacter molinativorax]
MTVNAVPYLTFDGKAREAMEFYHGIFGGELNVATYGEFGTPEDDPAHGWVMHAAITGGAITLAASDYDPRMTEDNAAYVVGNHLSISLWGDDIDEGTTYFNALSEGGTVGMPFETQIWGDTYGQLTDKFNIEWSVNVGAAAQPA